MHDADLGSIFQKRGAARRMEVGPARRRRLRAAGIIGAECRRLSSTPRVDLTVPATSEGQSKCAKPLTMNALISFVRVGIDSSDSSFCKGPVKVGASAESPAQKEFCIGRSRFLSDGNGTAALEAGGRNAMPRAAAQAHLAYAKTV